MPAGLNSLSDAMKMLISVAATVATLAAGAAGWMALGWWVPAGKDFVRVEVGKVAEPVYGLALEQRDRIRRTRDGLLSRRTAATDPQARDDLLLLIAQADRDIIEVEAHMVVLERLRRD